MHFALKEFMSFIRTEVKRSDDAHLKPSWHTSELYLVVALISAITVAFSVFFFWFFIAPEKILGIPRRG